MSVIAASYFDGKTSLRSPVSVIVAGGKVKVVGTDIDQEFDTRQVRRSLRIADTPRWLYLPGGGACVTADNAAVDRMTIDTRYEKILQRWESRPAYAGIAVALVVAMLWLFIDQGIPRIAQEVAERIPLETEKILGREAMSALDEKMMQKSKVAEKRQQALREKFAAIARATGDNIPYSLEFRASFFGPNAFALPSGIIVMLDDLVHLARNDEEVLAVLAHELGHVRHRHTMRRLLETSAVALLIAGVTGDIASTTSLAASAPALLMQTRYSRDNEREADVYAIDALTRAGISPAHLGRILTRIERSHGGGMGTPQFLSTHPATPERNALALAAAGEAPEAPITKDHDFTGLWKENCDDIYGYGLGFRRLPNKPETYSVSMCGTGGCLDSGTHRANTRIIGDPGYDVLSADEMFVVRGRQRRMYVRCSSEEPMEIAEK